VDKMDSIFSGSMVSMLLEPKIVFSKVGPVSSKTLTNHCKICFSSNMRKASTTMSNPRGHLDRSRRGLPQRCRCSKRASAFGTISQRRELQCRVAYTLCIRTVNEEVEQKSHRGGNEDQA
jgi:hypothetical protein